MKINNINIKLKDILEISKVLSPNPSIVSNDYYFVITLKTGKHYTSKKYNTFLECEEEIIKLENKIKIKKNIQKIIKAFLLAIIQILGALIGCIIVFGLIYFISSSAKIFVISIIIIIITLKTLSNYYN